ncbi:tRNA (guanine-N(7)-)-methyltransferase non-catalytic subunit wuho [Battus philenor]|uniref:tRNA (guanine-N(7)-)-methyltransferase non-catalytic subunit wuho n=1 Tax=Battus philenor TaxID=42288 RepID=UPI0035CFC921
MSSIAVSDNLIAVANGLHINCYDYSKHTGIDVISEDANDRIFDIIIASDCKHIAILTLISKQLIVYDWPTLENTKKYILPRSASKIRFSVKCDQIFVADKTGDVLSYDITKESNGIKLLGHLSLLLNILQTDDCKFIISCDRDEKIKVSCYPNTYNIQTYCLGHTEFVNNLELLPHNVKYLTSTSGDGTIKCWNYEVGKLCYSIDTFLDINDESLKNNFAKVMVEEGVEVNALPIVHYAISKVNESCSVIAVTVFSFKKILFYSLSTDNELFEHKLLQSLDIDQFPTSLTLNGTSLFVYYDIKGTVEIYKLQYEKANICFGLAESIALQDSRKESSREESKDIKLLYKRKFDNVQEYQERKKLRLNKA